MGLSWKLLLCSDCTLSFCSSYCFDFTLSFCLVSFPCLFYLSVVLSYDFTFYLVLFLIVLISHPLFVSRFCVCFIAVLFYLILTVLSVFLFWFHTLFLSSIFCVCSISSLFHLILIVLSYSYCFMALFSVFVLSCLFIVLAAVDLASATLCLINFFFFKSWTILFVQN